MMPIKVDQATIVAKIALFLLVALIPAASNSAPAIRLALNMLIK